MDRTYYPTYRMGRKRWVKLLGDLQSILKRAKRLKGASRCEYQQKINTVENALAALLNVIQHRGNHAPARWPCERKQHRRSQLWRERRFA